MGELYFIRPKLETQEQKDWAWEQLEYHERTAEDFRRMLGILAVEKGLE